MTQLSGRDPVLEKLINTAMRARERAYAPYSKHPVGSALISADGQVFSGCNVENAASPLGSCAEALAINSMVISGGRTIDHIVVAGPSHDLCSPCGGCRQMIREFSSPETKITVVDVDGKIMLETDIMALLPHSFGPGNLSQHIAREGQNADKGQNTDKGEKA